MKAICVTPDRRLEIRIVPTPEIPAPGHVLVDIDSAAITHGDKFFLANPLPGAIAPSAAGQAVYGANAAGRVAAIGADVPELYRGKQVAIYKSLRRSADSIGVWCERVHLPYQTCLILPDDLRARDYCGSFANVLTVHAFLSEICAAGHKAVIITAGTSATGHIAASLARRRNLPAIFLVRSAAARETLVQHGAPHVLVTSDEDFERSLAHLATELGATAVFDGVGGALLSRMVPNLPPNSTVYIYGFLGAASPATLSTMLVMAKNLTLRRFSNLESATVQDAQKLADAMQDIAPLMADPLFKTRMGKEFIFEQIDDAMAFEAASGSRAILVA